MNLVKRQAKSAFNGFNYQTTSLVQTSYTHSPAIFFFQLIVLHFNSLKAKKSSIILALLQQVYISKCIIINDIAASSLFIASVTHSLLESPCPTLVKLEQQQRQHKQALLAAETQRGPSILLFVVVVEFDTVGYEKF